MEGFNAEFHAERAKMNPTQSSINLRNRALFLDNIYIKRKKAYRMLSRRSKWVVFSSLTIAIAYVR